VTQGCASDDTITHNVERHGRASDEPNTQIAETLGCASDEPDVSSLYKPQTHDRAYLRGRVQGTGVAFREPKSMSSFVAGFKSAVTTRINTLRHAKGTPVWQERFHDHVIRDYEECRHIGAYIDSNISNWNEDRYYK